MPFAVAHCVLVLRNVGGNDCTAAVIDAEYHRTVDHLQQQVIATPVHRYQNTGRGARLHLEADVDIQTDAEVIHCISKTSVV